MILERKVKLQGKMPNPKGFTGTPDGLSQEDADLTELNIKNCCYWHELAQSLLK